MPSHCEITAAFRFEPFAHASWNDHYLRALRPSTARAPDGIYPPNCDVHSRDRRWQLYVDSGPCCRFGLGLPSAQSGNIRALIPLSP